MTPDGGGVMARIGIVLGAGLGKGAYQIGVLRAVEERFSQKDIVSVSCSSIGVLNGVGYRCGRLDELEQAWLEMAGGSFRGFIGSVLRSERFSRLLDDFAAYSGSLSGELLITLTDLTDMSADYCLFNDIPEKKRADYLRASVSIPGLTRCLSLGGKRCVDGGWIDGIPVWPLIGKELDYIICVYFDRSRYIFEDKSIDSKVLSVTFPDDTIFTNAVFLREESVRHMKKVGYDVACEIFDDVFSRGADDAEYVSGRINEINSRAGKRSLRLTTDVVITNVNRLAKHLTVRRILDDGRAVGERKRENDAK